MNVGVEGRIPPVPSFLVLRVVRVVTPVRIRAYCNGRMDKDDIILYRDYREKNKK